MQNTFISGCSVINKLLIALAFVNIAAGAVKRFLEIIASFDANGFAGGGNPCRIEMLSRHFRFAGRLIGACNAFDCLRRMVVLIDILQRKTLTLTFKTSGEEEQDTNKQH